MNWLPVIFLFNSVLVGYGLGDKENGEGYSHHDKENVKLSHHDKENVKLYPRRKEVVESYLYMGGNLSQQIPVFNQASRFGGDISVIVGNSSHRYDSIESDFRGALNMTLGGLMRSSDNRKGRLSSRTRKNNRKGQKKMFRKHRRRRPQNKENKRRRNIQKNRSDNNKTTSTQYKNSTFSHFGHNPLSQAFKYTEGSQKRRSNHPKHRKYPPKKGGYPPKKGNNYPPNNKRNPPKDRGGFRPNQPNRKKWNSPKPRADPDAPSRYKSLDTGQEKVQKHVVRLHNLMRAKVVPPAADMLAVSWYSAAAVQAQSWAEQCSEDRELDHPAIRWTSRYGNCGQNIHITYRKRRWAHVVRYWWSSKRYFSYGYDDNNVTEVGPYTQMAWYNSHQIGCGFAQCTNNNGKIFYKYVCNYCPAGNDPSRIYLPYTHGHQCSSCKDSCKSICTGSGCRLCTDGCPYSDLWVNCHSLNLRWHDWLCKTKTMQGVKRFTNCRATCQCKNKIT